MQVKMSLFCCLLFGGLVLGNTEPDEPMPPIVPDPIPARAMAPLLIVDWDSPGLLVEYDTWAAGQVVLDNGIIVEAGEPICAGDIIAHGTILDVEVILLYDEASKSWIPAKPTWSDDDCER
jgi:hypothetical protein